MSPGCWDPPNGSGNTLDTSDESLAELLDPGGVVGGRLDETSEKIKKNYFRVIR